MTIHAWCDYSYYDGLWTFAQLHVRCDDERIASWRVSWLNSSVSSQESKP